MLRAYLVFYDGYALNSILFSAQEFDKMQIPGGKKVCALADTLPGLFGDNRSLRFCALTSVGALFLFQKKERKK